MADLKAEIERLRRTERAGEYFQATELAYRLLKDAYLDEVGELRADRTDAACREISYLLTRAVLNCGAVDRARWLYEHKYRLHEHKHHRPIRSLGARLVKESALLASGQTRHRLLEEAAAAYASVHEDFEQERAYTAVNAATMSLLHGDREAARRWARRALALCRQERPAGAEQHYYNAATAAEAALVLGDLSRARAELERAVDAGLDEKATIATTFRQLKLICEHTGLDVNEVLEPIRVPGLVFYAGHIIAPPGQPGRFLAEDEGRVRDRIDSWFDANNVGAAYGSLAAGADILFAEACLDRGIALHVFLPFSTDEFVATSVVPSGGDWVRRFDACLSRCGSEAGGGSVLSYATRGAFLGDEILFDYGTRYSIGVALLHAGHLMTDLRLVAVYDGKTGPGYGTGKIVDYWRTRKLQADVIETCSTAEPRLRYSEDADPRALPRRRPKAIMFGDVVGFSKLEEQDIPRFQSEFMGLIAKRLEPYAGRITCQNSWGDAIYIVFDEAIDAARFGLDVQRAISALEFVPIGAQSPLSLRLAIHYGPVFEGIDGFNGTRSCFGVHVTHAARIEPVTPPGVVYVTEAMAAELELLDVTGACEFVGPIAAAKGFGDMLIYVLREAATADPG